MRFFAYLSLLLGLHACQGEATQNAHSLDLWVGSYTDMDKPELAAKQGIGHLRFDATTGQLQLVDIAAVSQNPSYLALHPSLSVLYAANELGGTGQFDLGRIEAYAIGAEKKHLQLLNSASSEGKYPCYVECSPDGSFLYVANYGGRLAMFHLHADGRLGTEPFVAAHPGKGLHPRQDTSHVHMVLPRGNELFAADLGTNQVLVYSVDAFNKKLLLKHQLQLPDSAGPRHMSLDASANNLYVINELDATVAHFQRTADDQWLLLRSYPVLAPGAQEGKCADLHLAPDGRFLYASSRGEHNSISVFAVDSINGGLAKVQERTAEGKGPRNFVLSPDGRFLLVAYQYTNEVVVLNRDAKTGVLGQVQHRLAMDKPVCLKFAKP